MASKGRTQKIGLLGATSYIVGNIVGSGIFITPTAILEQTNSVGLSLTVWLISALISMLASFCYVELGTSIRRSGADFAYLCYVKWFPIAFPFMLTGCIIIYPATLAVQAETFSEYIFKGFNIQLQSDSAMFYGKKLVGFSLVWLLAFLNFFSLKTFVSRFQIVATICKVVATGIVVGTGAYYLIFQGKTEHLKDPFKGSTFAVGSFVTALFSGLYSYDGWDILNFGAEEIERPKRTMPLAIVIGMTFVAILYLAVNIAYFVVMDVNEFLNSPAVAQTFAQIALGKFQYAIPFFVSILLVGSLNSTIFSASRYLQAASKQGHLPSFISCINPVTDSPRVAIMVHVLLAMGFSFVGDLESLINYVAFSQWSQRAFTMAALLYIRFRGVEVHPDAVKTIIVMPMLFFLICAALVIITIVDKFSVSAIGLGILGFGLIFYFLFIFERSLQSIHVYREYAHKANDYTTRGFQVIFNVIPDVNTEENAEVRHRKPTNVSEVVKERF